MILIIFGLLNRCFGQRDKNMRDARIISAALLALAGLIIVLVFASLFGFCGKPAPTINQESINKINSENETERKAELEKVITDNADTVKTIDNRTAITHLSVDERNREIRAKVKAADEAVSDAKRQGKDVTAEEIECLLVQKCEGGK